jgi:uroporphyrinogen decarboxylase
VVYAASGPLSQTLSESQKILLVHGALQAAEARCRGCAGPIQDFDFDVAILFSDLLFPLEALGMGLTYDPGPKLGWHLSQGNLSKFRRFDDALASLQFQKDALEETRKVLPKDKSLIGFVGGPWTLFTYACEGEHKGNLIEAKRQTDLYHNFCEFLMPLLEANIDLQLKGGAEVVMLFDTAAGELSPMVFSELLEAQLASLAKRFPGKLGYYSKGTTLAHVAGLRRMTEWAGFGLDHRHDLPAELKTNARGFLQGNFDQAMLFCDTDEFKRRLDAYLKPFQILSKEERRAWVCGLGHGVLPQTPEEHVRYFVRHVREVFGK